LDEETAKNLERVEGLLRAAKGALASDPDRAQRLLNQAHAVARESVTGGGQVTLPATLKGLSRLHPRPPGYWRA
jgi:hypothetical protein